MKKQTLREFFDKYHWIKQISIATRAGINPSLMRQYTNGIKVPSKKRLEEIEKAIHGLGKEMSELKIK